jgi:hypothetical protein
MIRMDPKFHTQLNTNTKKISKFQLAYIWTNKQSFIGFPSHRKLGR